MFRKYSSIENVWYNKEINWWLETYPHLKDAQYVLTEKLDGCCISFAIESDGSYKICKRSGPVGRDENFYNLDFIVRRKYIDVVRTLVEYAINNNATLNVYGEFFGTGIQNRIKYPDGKHILFFDVIVNEVLLSPIELEDFLSELNLEDMMVPNFGVVEGIDTALEFDVNELQSKVCDDLAEGIVMKPYYGTYNIPYGEDVPTTKIGRPFYLKKKNPKFKEKGEKKKKKNRKPIDSRLQSLHETFREYLNENRVLSVFSKHGEIEGKDQIGDYIKLVLEDMREDFEKEYFDELQGWKKKELKYIYNVSKEILKYLYKYL